MEQVIQTHIDQLMIGKNQAEQGIAEHKEAREWLKDLEFDHEVGVVQYMTRHTIKPMWFTTGS
jgi:hypothetical protein